MTSNPSVKDTPTTALLNSVPFIIVSGCLIALISFGPRSVLGLFLEPMTSTYGWSRETFALALAIQNLLWGAGQPIAGALADKYGAARIIALGGIVYGLGLLIMATAATPAMLHLSAGVLIGLGMSAASFSIVLAAFGRKVSAERRSIAFGIGTAAGSMGQFLFGPFAATLITSYGFELALIILSATLILVPLMAPILRGKGSTAAAGPEQTIAQALNEAFRHRSYNLLVAGFFVCGFQVAFITVHLPAYLADKNIDPIWGGWSIALIGLFNVFGSLASGVIGTKMSKPVFLALIYLGRGIATIIFLLVPVTPLSVLLFSSVMGLLWLSTVPPTSALVAGMFGPRYMATLFGFVFFSHQIGSFLGVWLGGRLYDTTGSYDAVWYLSIALSVFAAIVHWPIKEAPVARLQNV